MHGVKSTLLSLPQIHVLRREYLVKRDWILVELSKAFVITTGRQSTFCYADTVYARDTLQYTNLSNFLVTRNPFEHWLPFHLHHEGQPQ